MASSKVMASRSPPNPDLPRQPSSSSPLILHSNHSRGFASMNIDDYLRNMYSDSDSFALQNNSGGGESECGRVGSSAVDGGGGEMRNNGNGNSMVDGVWRNFANSGAAAGGGSVEPPPMTLEDFIAAESGVANEENVGVPAMATRTPPPPTIGGFGIETIMMNPAAVQFAPAAVCVQNGFGLEFGNGMAASSGGGRGKRRAAVEEAPLDKATQQKQRRMIKNRESAARSRERKQAYTVELESLVTKLEEDNATLLKEEAKLNKERYNQLMENLIPVTEKRRPPRVLRRLNSMEW